jgi:S1-C subfamily serine protease
MTPPVDQQHPADARPALVIFHLSGLRRGLSELLTADHARIGTAAGSEVQLPDEEPQVAPLHATLNRAGDSYEIEPVEPNGVWVNGRRVEGRRALESGDVMEIGQAGPLLRYRAYPAGSKAYKSIGEAFSDGVVCARESGRPPLGKAALLVGGVTRDLLTQTSVRFRLVVALLLALLGSLLVAELRRGQSLETQLADQELRVTGLAEMLRRSEETALRPADLAEIETELDDRLEALEYRSQAARRIIGSASASVVFLQGAYGYVETSTDRPLRYQLGADGSPMISPLGEPRIGFDGEGPPVEAIFTGTGFLATADGLILTNRHVAVPWDFDTASESLRSQGLEPRMSRFLGYLPGAPEPFEIELVLASDLADVAVLRCSLAPDEIPALPLSDTPPEPGDEIFVLGYPTGVRALLARADNEFLRTLQGIDRLDFWGVAKELARRGYIAPLATRGIVGQVTDAAVVYDAETAGGGSGGPVVNADGEVVAVNAAILPEFGGSNLGVPAGYARQLIATAQSSPRGAPQSPPIGEPTRE